MCTRPLSPNRETMPTAFHHEPVRLAPGTATAKALREAHATTRGIRVTPGTAVAERWSESPQHRTGREATDELVVGPSR